MLTGRGKKKAHFFFPGGVCYCCLGFTTGDKDYWSLFSEVCNNPRNGCGPGADIFMSYKLTFSIPTAFEQNTVVCERKKLEYGEEASPPEPIVMPSRKKVIIVVVIMSFIIIADKLFYFMNSNHHSKQFAYICSL